MNRSYAVRLLCAACLAGAPLSALAWQSAPEPPGQPMDEETRLQTEAAARWERLQAQAEADRAAQRAAQESYERGVREAEEARARYEADAERHREEVARAREAEADYQRRLSEHEAETRGSRRPARTERTERERPARVRQARASPADCQRRAERRQGRGRALGSLLGGIAQSVGGQLGATGDLLSGITSVGQVLGEAMVGLLDCDEQVQAASATEQAVEGGVGATSTWTSETRPGVSGSSTVTAMEEEPGGGACVTVTDIVIIDGEETRAPKRMCRRPPSNRFVRV